MIKFLSDLGRGFVILGALVSIFACTLAGYLTMPDLVGIGLGFFSGCIVSGMVFGIVATLYDIRDNIRLLMEREGEAPLVSEPYIAKPENKPDDLRAM